MSPRDDRIAALHRVRPRNRFLRFSVVVLVLMGIGAFVVGDFDLARLGGADAAANLSRFAGKIVPRDLRGDAPVTFGRLARWVGEVMARTGWRAAGQTLAISVLAIVLAGAAALVLAPGAARTLATPAPYLPGGRPPRGAVRIAWGFVAAATRGLFVLLRAIPEYVWAFLLLTMLGPTAWPAVLALALHNAGILGKLGADTLENAAPEPLAALRGLGASRGQIVAFGALPGVFGRFLLYFFTRWETCVREATVLGVLGVASLGAAVAEAEVRRHFGEMILLILVGSALVVLGDAVSTFARGWVRRAS